MDPFVQWLTSTFGTAAPQIAASSGFEPPVPQMPGLGESLDPVPLPVPRPAEAPQAGAPMTAQAQAAPGANQLASALRGMVPPTVPAAQRVATPGPPRLNDIKGGELLALLMATQEGGVPGGRKINPMPATLGQALSVPRY